MGGVPKSCVDGGPVSLVSLVLIVAGLAALNPFGPRRGNFANYDWFVDVERISLNVGGKLTTHLLNDVGIGGAFGLLANWEQVKLPEEERHTSSWHALRAEPREIQTGELRMSF